MLDMTDHIMKTLLNIMVALSFGAFMVLLIVPVAVSASPLGSRIEIVTFHSSWGTRSPIVYLNDSTSIWSGPVLHLYFSLYHSPLLRKTAPGAWMVVFDDRICKGVGNHLVRLERCIVGVDLPHRFGIASLFQPGLGIELLNCLIRDRSMAAVGAPIAATSKVKQTSLFIASSTPSSCQKMGAKNLLRAKRWRILTLTSRNLCVHSKAGVPKWRKRRSTLQKQVAPSCRD